jgi:hypothetical protein
VSWVVRSMEDVRVGLGQDVLQLQINAL